MVADSVSATLAMEAHEEGFSDLVAHLRLRHVLETASESPSERNSDVRAALENSMVSCYIDGIDAVSAAMRLKATASGRMQLVAGPRVHALGKLVDDAALEVATAESDEARSNAIDEWAKAMDRFVAAAHRELTGRGPARLRAWWYAGLARRVLRDPRIREHSSANDRLAVHRYVTGRDPGRLQVWWLRYGYRSPRRSQPIVDREPKADPSVRPGDPGGG